MIVNTCSWAPLSVMEVLWWTALFVLWGGLSRSGENYARGLRKNGGKLDRLRGIPGKDPVIEPNISNILVGGLDLRWLRGATNEHAGGLWARSNEAVAQRQASLSQRERAGRFWAATASCVAYIAQLCCAPRSLFRYKIGPANWDITYVRLNNSLGSAEVGLTAQFWRPILSLKWMV